MNIELIRYPISETSHVCLKRYQSSFWGEKKFLVRKEYAGLIRFHPGRQYTSLKIQIKQVALTMYQTFVGNTGLGKRVVPRLRELAPCGQRESGGGIHAT